MEGKGSFFILLFIVAFLSLTLAVLAGYVFFVAGSTPKSSTEATKQESTQKPKESELASSEIFEGKKYINLKTSDANKLAVLQVSVKIKFFKGKVKDEKLAEEIIKPYLDEMREATISYFGNMTLEQAKNTPEAMSQAKKDLLKIYNEIVPADEKTKKSTIYSVVIADWLSQ